MEIKINLNDIFCDEFGQPDESIEDSIRRQVLNRLTEDYKKRIFSRFDEELQKVFREQITAFVKEKIPEMLPDILDTEYTPVNVYGDRGKPTTFRKAIVDAIHQQLIYQPKSYSSEENVFTRAVKSVVEAKTTEIKNTIVAEVDTQFKTDAIKFAVQKLSERLGIAK